jgi:flagellar protein FlaG
MAIDLVKQMGAAQPAPVASNNARSAASQVAAQVAAKAASQNQESRKAVQAAARELESHMLGMGRSLEFRVDTQTNTTVVMVRDKNSGEVIRQMPSEEALWLARHLEVASNFLLNTSA